MQTLSKQQMQSVQGGVMLLSMLAGAAVNACVFSIIAIGSVTAFGYALYRGVSDWLDSKSSVEAASSNDTVSTS